MGDLGNLVGLVVVGAIAVVSLEALGYNEISKKLQPQQSVMGTVREETYLTYPLGLDEYLLSIDTQDGHRMVIDYNPVFASGSLRDLDASLVAGDKVKVTVSPYVSPDCKPTASKPCKTTFYGRDAELVNGN